MEDHVDEKKSLEADNVERKEEEDEEGREEAVVDPELFSCLLQPSSPDADSEYVGIRRLLLYRKAQAGVYRRNVQSLSLLDFRSVFVVVRVSFVNVEEFRNLVF